MIEYDTLITDMLILKLMFTLVITVIIDNMLLKLHLAAPAKKYYLLSESQLIWSSHNITGRLYG